MKIYIKESIPTEYIERLKQTFTNDTFVTTKDVDSQMIIAYPYEMNEPFLKDFKKLKHIQLLTSGYDLIDLDYLKNRKIHLYNAKDIYSIPIAEYVLANVLAFEKKVIDFNERKKVQLWQNDIAVHDISGKTVGIIGAGDIGREIAKRFKTFETTVLGYKRTYETLDYFDVIYTSKDDLDKLVQTSDYIVIALSLNEHTKHFIDKRLFKMMKPSALIINIARGLIIHQEDLMDALDQNLIRGAILDVTTPEPLPKMHKLWTYPNVIITPHNSNLSHLTNQRLCNLFIKTIQSIKENKIPNNQIV